VTNWVAGHVDLAPTILYGLRVAEYFAIYPLLHVVLGDSQAARRAMIKILAVATCVHVLVAAAQVATGLQIGFSRFAYDRGAGLTSGPYEMGAICAALACFWLARRSYGLSAVSVLGVVLSASRISIVGVAIGLFLTFWFTRRPWTRPLDRDSSLTKESGLWPWKPLGAALVMACLLASSPVWIDQVAGGATSRTASTSLSDSWRTAAAAADGTLALPDSATYQQLAYSSFTDVLHVDESEATDVSNVVRFYRWNLLLDQMSFGRVFLGLGPSYAGPSVDGAFLRILVESGLIGLAAWGALAVQVVRKTPRWLYGALFTFVVGCLFIDLPFAMRPVVLIWGLVAYSQATTSEPTSV
jgi:hypothetical protein